LTTRVSGTSWRGEGIGDERETDLDAEIGCGLSNESERCTDMNSLNDVERIIWSCMYHFVECEPCVVNYVVDFAKSSDGLKIIRIPDIMGEDM